MSIKRQITPGEGIQKRKATGEDDVEGHSFNRSKVAADEFTTRKVTGARKATGEDDVEGHWMPEAGSAMRLAKVRSADVERGSRQHQLESEARQHRIDHDPKRTHTKG